MKKDVDLYPGKRSFAPCLSVFLVALLVLWAPCALGTLANGKLQIYHIDVGQGDGALIISPLGQTAMIDDGTYTNCSTVVNYIKGLGVTSIDYHFASHYHSDHIGCLDDLLAASVTLNIAGYDRGYSYSSSMYTDYVNALGTKRQTMAKNQVVTLDAGSTYPVYIKCVDLNGAGVYSVNGSDENPKSMVIKISYGNFDEVFGGDLTGSPAVEAKVGPEVGDVEVYKVHHHGSATSSYDAWLTATTPEVAVISVGNNNSYGHPTSDALARLHGHGVKTYWTETGAGVSPVKDVDKVGGNIIIQASPLPGAAYTVSGTGFTDTYYNNGQADTTPPTVGVTKPNGGEIFYAGYTDTIRWTATDNVGVDSVSIYYSVNGGSSFPYTIATRETNDGVYVWTIPGTLSDSCRVKVVAYDAALNQGSDTSNNNFRIAPPPDTTPPTVGVTKPNGGEIFYAGYTDTIRWTATDNVGVDSVSIYYSMNDGSSFPYTIATREMNDGVYVWTIPGTLSSSYRVKVVAYDAALNQGSDMSDGNFSVVSPPDTTPPQVALTEPYGGEALYVGSEDTIRWVATDNVGVDSVSIYYSVDDGQSFTYTIVTGQQNDSCYVWTIPDTPSDSCVVKIVAYDSSLNIGEATSDTTFSIASMLDAGTVPEVARFGLLQNYPNPFNPVTRIQFSLAERSRVSVAVYDISGKLVRTLVNESLSKGTHVANWDGEDDSGEVVASGVYVCKLEASSGKTAMRKMILLK